MKHLLLASLVAATCFGSTLPCKAVFTEQAGVMKELIKDIRQEQHLVQIAAGHIGNRQVIDALLDARKRGVIVEVIVDDLKKRPKTCMIDLFRNNVPVFVYKPDNYYVRSPHMSHRFCVLSKKVWMGNFSLNKKVAQSRRESAVVLSQSAVVEDFMREFEFLKLKKCKRAIL